MDISEALMGVAVSASADELSPSFESWSETRRYAAIRSVISGGSLRRGVAKSMAAVRDVRSATLFVLDTRLPKCSLLTAGVSGATCVYCLEMDFDVVLSA